MEMDHLQKDSSTRKDSPPTTTNIPPNTEGLSNNEFPRGSQEPVVEHQKALPAPPLDMIQMEYISFPRAFYEM